MQKSILLLFLIALLACNEKEAKVVTEGSIPSEIKYAEGLEITTSAAFTVITITNPWPGADKAYRYALTKDKANFGSQEGFDAVIEVPVRNLVVTSTTHIPSLEMLGALETLKGFPNLDYISSETTRALISERKIRELGKNEDLNTEVLIDLAPDALVGFAVDGNNTNFCPVQKTGIPVLYNSDWTETHPLGKAEWIKLFGALLDKQTEANTIFSEIEKEYSAAKELAAKATHQPTVLSGAMYKDVWYLPQGNSWAAQFIADANGTYLWQDTEGTGSLSLNLEAVLENGKAAQYWIGPGQFTSLDQMKDTHSVYTQFDAFTNNEVYSFTTKKGATGGVLYYELAPNRPDLVLKDIIKILHPELLMEHELFFFSKLK